MIIRSGHLGLLVNINVSEFKAKCLKLIDEVATTREPLVITKRGKVVARVVPVEDDQPHGMFGYMQGTVTIHDDILNMPHEPWAAESGEEDDLYGLPCTGQSVTR